MKRVLCWFLGHRLVPGTSRVLEAGWAPCARCGVTRFFRAART